VSPVSPARAEPLGHDRIQGFESTPYFMPLEHVCHYLANSCYCAACKERRHYSAFEILSSSHSKYPSEIWAIISAIMALKRSLLWGRDANKGNYYIGATY
jgi:hypothetical protein